MLHHSGVLGREGLQEVKRSASERPRRRSDELLLPADIVSHGTSAGAGRLKELDRLKVERGGVFQPKPGVFEEPRMRFVVLG